MTSKQQLAKEIGQRLRVARLSAGYKNVIDFAIKLGLPRSTYNQYELGSRLMSLDTTLQLVELYKTNLIWLLTGKGSPDFTDDDLVKDGVELINENEFFDIVKNKTNLPIKVNSRYRKHPNTFNNDLMAEIFNKVFQCYQSNGINKLDFKLISEMSLGIYFDVIDKGFDKESINHAIDVSISTLNRTLSRKQIIK